jgi:hypothetical protein
MHVQGSRRAIRAAVHRADVPQHAHHYATNGVPTTHKEAADSKGIGESRRSG